MRLRSLDVEDYGLFSNRSLTFEARGLQLIYGPNGAGKTTLLSLLRDLLFGVPPRSPYNYRDNVREIAATATMEAADGRSLRFRRRKGNKDVVAGEFLQTGETIDEESLAQLLDGAGSDLYNHLFAFSQEELAAGTRSLQQARPNEVLFGMGIGRLATFRQMQEAIAKEQRELFLPTGKNPRINQLLRELKTKHFELQDAVLSPQEYARQQAEIDELAGRVEQLEAALQQMEEERQHLTRTLEVLPLATLHDDLVRRFGEKDEKARSATAAQVAEYERLLRDREKLTADIVGMQPQAVADVQDEPLTEAETKVLGLADRIRLLHQQAGEVRRRQEQREEHGRQREEIMADVRTLRKSLGWSGEGSPLTLPSRSEVNRITADYLKPCDDLFRQQELIMQRCESLRTRKSQIADRLDTLPDEQLSAEADELHVQAGLYRHDRDRLVELQSHRQQVTAQREVLTQQLSQRLPTTHEPIESLIVPDAEEVERLASRWRRSQEDVDRRAAAVAELQSQLDGLSDTANEGADPPSDGADLSALRTRRDAGWTLIRRRYVDRDDSRELTEAVASWTNGAPHRLPDLYEELVAQCDAAADEAHRGAGESAREVERAYHRQRLAQRIEHKAKECDAAEEARDQCRREFDTLWSASGVLVGEPDEMVEWLQLHKSYLAAQSQLSRIDGDLETTRQSLAAFELRLQQVLSGMTNSDAATGDPLETFERRYTKAQIDAAERRRLIEDLEKLDLQLNQDVEHQQRLESNRTALVDELRSVLQRWSIEVGADDPATSPGTDLHERLRLIATLGERQADEQRLADVIYKSQKEADEWADDVTAVCKDAELAQEETSPFIAIEEALKTVNRLEERQRNIEAASRARAQAADLIKIWNEQLATTKEQVAALGQMLGIEIEEDSSLRLEEIRDALAIQARLSEVEGKLQAVVGSHPGELSTTALDETALKARLKELTERRDAHRRERQSAAERLGVARDRMDRLAAEDRTSRLAAERESLLAQLATEVDSWAALVLSQRLMDRALKRFEANHQPRVLEQGGRMLARMTGGDYVAVHRQLSSQPGQMSLLIESAAGERLTPDALSRGTHQQLYLALRLALVDEYCERSEPLPIAMDDVLVDFDDARAFNTLELLSEFAADRQVLFLTCHERIVRMVSAIQPETPTIELVPGSLTAPASSKPRVGYLANGRSGSSASLVPTEGSN